MNSQNSDWIDVPLGKVIQIFDHKRIPVNSREREKRKGQYPYYGASGIVDYIDGYLFDGRYLLIAEDGENLNSRKTPIVFFADGKFWVNNHAHIVRAIPNLADDYFIMSSIQNMNISGYITGAAQPKLTQANLCNITIKLPNINIQQKISTILSAYDDLIENNTRRIRILEEMAQAIYREWFVHFCFPGHEGIRMVESPLGPIPEGWEVCYFTDIVDVLSGGTPKTSVHEYWGQEIPWFTPQDLTGNFFVIDTVRKITALGLSKCSSKLYPRNTTFITARGTVGKCVLTSVPMAMSQTNYALQGKKQLSPYFVYLLTLQMVDNLKQQATGAVFDTIIVDTFRKLLVISPILEIIHLFDQIVHPTFLLIENLQKRNANLRHQRDLLLPRLISGELDVEGLEIPTIENEA